MSSMGLSKYSIIFEFEFGSKAQEKAALEYFHGVEAVAKELEKKHKGNKVRIRKVIG